jgi:hypothetical protein
MELYTCTKSVNEFVEGSNYYVQIDDVKSKYIESFESSYFYIPDDIKAYVNNIKPLIWVVTDNGIGTLKSRDLFIEEVYGKFDEHFTKYEN